jgi:hypothetical protein
MDGDCGIHTMRLMLQLPHSIDSAKEIRVKLHDYLIERIRESWMHDVLLVRQEISKGELDAHRSCGTLHPGHALATYALADAPADDTRLQIYSSREVTDELLEALAWSTGVKERGLLASLAVGLPEVMRDEQLRKDQLAKLQDTRQGTDEPNEVIVFAQRLASRMQATKQYYDYLRSCGWTEGEREPYGARRRFIERIRWVGRSTRDTLRT